MLDRKAKDAKDKDGQFYGGGLVKQRRKFVMMAGLFLVLAMLAAACTKNPGGTTASPNPNKAITGKPGGTLVFGAEQFPDCLNPITSCSNSSWLLYVTNPILPGLLILDANNDYIPSPLVKEVPTVDNKQVTESPFTVTYNLNPKAVWDDGSPITGADVKFTWQAIMQTPDALSRIGYDKIKDITTTGSKVKIEFTEPYAPYKNLFAQNGVLKAAAFGGQPNLTGKMQDSYGFSGGPFKLDSFNPQEMVLSRNEKFWGKKAFLDKIVFKPLADSTAEVNAFKTGEIQAFFPQPTVELVDQVKSTPGGDLAVKAGTVYEGLWFNLDAEPVKNKEVRQALLDGLDRQAVIDAVIKPIDPKATVNQCLFSVTNLAGGKYCPKDFPTKVDKTKATKGLETAGWAKGADGIYAKGGKRLSIKFATTAGNKGREQSQQILIAQAKELGIEIVVDNSPAATLFQTRLPARQFVMAEFAQVATPDPSVTSNWAKDQIPSKEHPDGANQIGWANDEATALMYESDKEVDDSKRTDQIVKISGLAFKDLVSIPFFSKPQILVYNKDRLLGDFDFNAGQAGFSYQLSTWSCKKAPTC